MRDAHSSESAEIAGLAQRVATARGRLPLQHDAALVEVLSDAEIEAERELAEWVRAQRRGQRKRAVEDELTAEKRGRRTMSAIRRDDEADARWHRRALAARRRVSNQDARLAQLYRRAEWSSRALIAVVILGMVWAGVNVQHNLVPSGDMSDPLYWLSYGIEAMISIPIITIMVAATTAARWGRELDRGKIIFFEIALLGTTVALNAGPHLAAGSWGRAAEYSIAPVMVGVVIWLHAWISARYAMLIDSVPIADDEEPEISTRHHVTAQRGDSIAGFRADDPADRRELLAATDFDPLRQRAGVRFPGMTEQPVRAETLLYAQSTTRANSHLTQPLPMMDTDLSHGVAEVAPVSRSMDGTAAPTAPVGTGGHADSATPRGDTPTYSTLDGSIGNGAESVPSANAVAQSEHPVDALQEAQASAKPAAAARVRDQDADRSTTEPEQVVRETATDTADESQLSMNFDTPAAATEARTENESAGRTTESVRGTDAETEPDSTHEPAQAADRVEPPPATGAANTVPGAVGSRRTTSEVISDVVQAISAEDLLVENPILGPDDDDVEVWAVARAIAGRGLSVIPVEQLAEILMLADQGMTPTSISAEVGLSRAAIGQVLDFARKVRRPFALSV